MNYWGKQEHLERNYSNCSYCVCNFTVEGRLPVGWLWSVPGSCFRDGSLLSPPLGSKGLWSPVGTESSLETLSPWIQVQLDTGNMVPVSKDAPHLSDYTTYLQGSSMEQETGHLVG